SARIRSRRARAAEGSRPSMAARTESYGRLKGSRKNLQGRLWPDMLSGGGSGSSSSSFLDARGRCTWGSQVHRPLFPCLPLARPLTAQPPVLHVDAHPFGIDELPMHARRDPEVVVDHHGVGAADPREARPEPQRAILRDLLTEHPRPDGMRGDRRLAARGGVEIG